MSKRPILILILTSVCLLLNAQQTFQKTKYDENDGLSSLHVGGCLEDKNGLLWFSTWNGLNCYDGYQFHRVSIQPGDHSSIGTNHILDICKTQEGNILCHTPMGISLFDLQHFKFIDIPTKRQNELKKYVGKHWHGTTDKCGNRWTSDATGLYKTYKVHHPARLIPNTKGEQPRAFLQDPEGNVWIGTSAKKSIQVYSCDWSLMKKIDTPFAPYVIYRCKNGDIWIGGKTPGGLMKVGGEVISNDDIYDIKEDNRGRLWIATSRHGIRCCANPTAEKPTLTQSLGGKTIKKLLITPKGHLVAATTQGLLLGQISEKVEDVHLHYVTRNGTQHGSLSNNSTISITQDSKGRIYIGTESSGIDYIQEDELFSNSPVFTHLNTNSSTLVSDFCNAFTLQNDSLLIIAASTNVMAYNTLTGQTTNLGKYFWNDSVNFIETTPIVLKDGSWLVGTKQGAFLATKHNIYSRGYRPYIVFTTLSVEGSIGEFCLPGRRSIPLKVGQRNITIGFAAIDYTNNSDIMYRSSLDKSSWTTASRNRSVSLFNLSAGRHILRVQSTDRFGRWVDNVCEMEIIVKPYWYETLIARILFSLLSILLIGLIVYTVLYIRKVKRQRQDLLKKYMDLLNQNDTQQEPSDCLQESKTTDDKNDLSPEDAAFLNRIIKYIQENIGNENATVDDMASASASSKSTLTRRLRTLMGVSPMQFLINARLQHAATLLAHRGDTGLTIPEIAMKCGYANVQYFRRAFKKTYQINPEDYKERL